MLGQFLSDERRKMHVSVDEAHARRRMISFCADADVPELSRLARTISRWAELIFAYHRTAGASNGRVENVHMLAEKIRRTAQGFTNHTSVFHIRKNPPPRAFR